MHIHILGICGTFMGGIAILAREMGMTVSGSDSNVYPPMSTQLETQGIALCEGFNPRDIPDETDIVVIGNALSRGNAMVEHALNRGLNYCSGPAFLAQYILKDCWVLAVAGTHGKSSTASMLAWILEDGGLAPGFLIGAVADNFGISARKGDTPFFVVEADEYDTAFFDKRAKFVHYHPRTVILNNLEYDHADIYDNIGEIRRQFHHLVRTIPSNGLIIAPHSDPELAQVLEMGCWTPVDYIETDDNDDRTGDWSAANIDDSGQAFDVCHKGQSLGRVEWSLIGQHNIHNALAAIIAARHAGVPTHCAIEALHSFKGIKRRMEERYCINDITIYDDFAHHPSAIKTTINGLKQSVAPARVIAIFEPRSNTMKMGIHKDTLAPAFNEADETLFYQADDLPWSLQAMAEEAKGHVFTDIDTLIKHTVKLVNPGDTVLIMSNGSFDNIHERLANALRATQADKEVSDAQ